MIKSIMVTLLAISATRQACDVGCLKCSVAGDCLIPDILNSYYLNGTTATKASLSNCTLVNIDGKCVGCGAGFYLDSATDKCVAVATASLVTNCAAYSSATTCGYCSAGYYFNNNVCAAVETTISNCETYSGASACWLCAKGYLLELDSKSCTATPSISNCGDFTFVKCHTCDAGYVLYPNNYLNLALVSTSASDRNLLTAFATAVSGIRSQQVAQGACQVASTTNCALFDEGNNACTQCSSGYYLDAPTVTCIVFPDEPIENCLNYDSLLKCSECVGGFYLKNNVCTQIAGTDVITNCSTYNGKAITVQCVNCSANFYLNNNSCSARVNSASGVIASCATNEVVNDMCAACSAGAVLSSDGLACFAAINNCSTYVSTSKSQVLRCSVCNDTFYLTDTDSSGANSCQPGSVDKCKTYALNSGTTCSVCLNSFYLSSNACVSHVTISSCTTYNTSTANLCFSCANPGFFNFYLEKYCQTLPSTSTINFCTAYTSDITTPQCTACSSGYFVKANVCEAIQIDNCLSLDASNNCNACAQGFAIAEDGKSCLNPLTFVTDNCLTNSTSDASNSEFVSQVDCNVCQTGSVPFDLTNYFVCISATDAKQYKPDKSTVDGCIKYDENMVCVQCDVDGSKPFLDTSDSTCKTSCTNGVAKYRLMNLDANSYNISQLNVCATTAVLNLGALITGCGVYAPDLTTVDQPMICIKCLDTYLSILAPAETKYSNVDPSASNLNLFFPSAFAKFPKVTCRERISGTTSFGAAAAVANVTSIGNCSYYLESSATNFSCLRCDAGYYGQINGASSKVIACVPNSVCTTDKYYNLDTAVNNLTSCYKCNNNNIPFIAMTVTSTTVPVFTGFATYNKSVSGGVFSSASGSEVYNVVCRPNDKSELNMTTGYNVAADCGIAILNVGSNGTFDSGTSYFGAFCAACKPGYKGTSGSGTYSYVYSQCTAIANCASTSTFYNACSACNSGFILNYTASDIDYQTCLSIPTATSSRFDNCLAASATINTTNASVCEICKTGYFLNEDSICERYQPLNCESGLFTPVQKKSSTSNLNWSLWLNSNTLGCSKCGNTMLAYKMATKKVTCIKGDWVSRSVDSLSTTAYIPNCKYYGINTAVGTNRVCDTCNTNFVISGVLDSGVPKADGLKCFSNPTLNNCAIAKDANTCLQCVNSTFSLRNAACELGNIANCVAYNFNVSNATVKCTTCAQDYYLDTVKNMCVLGEIYNCRVLDSNNSKGCNTCATGFVKVTNPGANYDVCYPVDTLLGCSALALSNDATNNGGRVSCTACTNNSSQLVGAPPSTSAKSICMAHSLIANCKSYNIGSTLSTSSFRCTECTSGYYLNANNRCVVRVYQPAKCSLYDLDDDICLKCDNTSYLSTNKRICVDYPKGILGCRTYSNATTCTACKEGRYLNANFCPKVPTAIANCQFYSSSNSCSLCATNYVLINNICVKAIAANCTTYTSETVCSGCPQGYILKTESNVTNCVAFTKTGCLNIDISNSNNCLLCSGSYYLEAGDCKNPTTISNCAVYATKVTCARCNKGYALSALGDACVNSSPAASYIDSQCVDSHVFKTAVCSRCSPGYFFVDGACTGSCNTGVASGCLACDPKKATTCYVCKTGFYQTKDGACNDDNPASGIRLFAGLLTALVAFLSLML